MTWDDLYPVVKEQAYWAVLRYDPRRQDKIQELIAQSYEKYFRDISRGKEITVQDYKYFVTNRAKQLDTRSVCKKGLGGTSVRDALSFYRRRPDSGFTVVEFDDWLAVPSKYRNKVEDNLVYKIDFSDWKEKLNDLELKTLKFLLAGGLQCF